MANINRVQVALTGGTMGAGVATHYFEAGHGGQAAISAFWTACGNIMAGQVSATIPNTGDVFDASTGELVNVWTEGTQKVVGGGGSGGFAGGVGACIGWSTSAIVPPSKPGSKAFKLRGRTFIVPLASNSYDTDGSLTAAVLGTLTTAANALVLASSGFIVIWHRPSVPDVNGNGTNDGMVGPITGFRVKDRVSSLKSRR